ncbi:hypothetical protein GCM10020229_51860 [Kitasatospora albolonga]
MSDVPAGRDHFQRCAGAVADQVVLAARLAAIDRRRANSGTPLYARTWEASTQARVQPIRPAAFNSARSIR